MCRLVAGSDLLKQIREASARAHAADVYLAVAHRPIMSMLIMATA